MGIIFDGRKFNSKRSPQGELLSNDTVINRIRFLVVNALLGEDRLPFNLNKNLLSIKGKRTRYSGDRTFKSLKVKGSFENVDPNNENTWKSAKVEQIQYKGKDGIINIKQIEKSDSLGTLYNWSRIERIDEFIFRGDDIIYSEKNGRSNAYIDGFAGDDVLYLYGGENARGSKGKDKFIITKEAVKYMKTRKKNFGYIDINDASFAEGDKIEILATQTALISIQMDESWDMKPILLG